MDWIGIRLGIGEILDNIIFKPGKTSSLPTADAVNRGGLLRQEGGSGVADQLLYANKDASDAYAWTDLLTHVPTHNHDASYVNVGGDTMTGDLVVPDEAYGVGWDGSLEVPTKNAVYDKIEAFSAGAFTDENARDVIATALVAGNNIDITVNDALDQITIAVETLTLADISDVTASAAELNVLDGVTSSTAELNILDGVTTTASELNVLDGITATVTELNYTDGVTSAIQTQLDGKQPLDADLTTIAGLTATTNNFMVGNAGAWASRTPAQALAHLGLDADLPTLSVPASTTISAFGSTLVDDANAATALVTLGLTATAAEINTLDGITASTAELNTLDGITATTAELNTLDGITATTTELNYTDGVTSAIQTQINTKAPTASPTFTGTVTLPTTLTGVLRADTGVVSTDSDVTDLVSAASTTAAGKVELATTAETTTGTDATRAVTPDGLHDMTSLTGAAWFLDEDAMTSNSASKTVSQQSVKAYADTKAPLSHTHAASDITSGTMATARLGSGTANSSSYLRGDSTWDAISLAELSDVSIATPAQGQLLTYDSVTGWVNADPQQGIMTLDDRTHSYVSQLSLTECQSLWIDSSDNIYVSFKNGASDYRIRKYNSSLSLQWTSGLSESASPTGIAATAFTAWVLAADGWMYAISLSSGAGVPSPAHNIGANPGHITCDGTYFYAVSREDSLVYKISSGGSLITTWGGFGSGDGVFDNPVGITTDGTYVYVVDQDNDRIQKFTTSGAYISKWGRSGSDPGEFQTPVGIHYNSVTGTIYVTDSGRDDVQEFTTDGAFIGSFGAPGTGNGEFQSASGIASDVSGDSVWVADATQDRLQKFTRSVTSEEATRVSFNPNDFIVSSTDGGETGFISFIRATDTEDHGHTESGDGGLLSITPTITQRTNSTTLANGASGSISVTCSAGETVIGGGCQIDSGSVSTPIARSRVDASGWTCTYGNTSGATRTITSQAICLTTPLST